jgi:hypothetical protein
MTSGIHCWTGWRSRAARAIQLASPLAGLVFLAGVVRLIGPLREPALGQSDAYAHLQFLNDILTTGRLRHAFYPPGYYWLLAIPTRLFNLDPYGVMRYAGAVFGGGLVLALFWLTHRAFGRRAALWTAFLVAACPAFHWLQKTGVGAFPSQLGLLLAPLALLAWDGVARGRTRCWAGWLAAMVLLALSVPMMLLDLLPLLALDAGVRLSRREIGRSALIGLGMAAAVMAGGILFMLVRGGAGALVDTACLIAGLPPTEGPAWMTLGRVAATYAAPQRWGPSGGLVQLGAAGVGAALIGLLMLTWRQNAAARMIGLWAVLTWAQSVFGVFQFALYMRAGWMLLAAMAILGGWLIEQAAGRLPLRPRRLALGVLAATALVSLRYPPLPRPHLSPAESDLVRVARDLAAGAVGRDSGPTGGWLHPVAGAGNLIVWSRPYTAFPGHQGDPLHALLEHRDGIDLRSVDARAAAAVTFDPDFVHLLLLDDGVGGRHAPGLMQVVNPALSDGFERMRERLMATGPVMRERIERAELEGWTVTRRRLPQGLDVVWLSRNR